MSRRFMKEKSPEQKAFAGLLTPESATDYLNQYPPVPKMRATYPRTVEGGSMLHPRYQHRKLPDLKPGDKGYMNRGMMMEMGYKALKEQGSLIDFVNSVAPVKKPASGSLTDFVNTVTGRSSASSTTPTLKQPRTLKNYATNNFLDGYTSKDKGFNSADIRGRYTATDDRTGTEYDSNSITTRTFGRGGDFKTITGSGRGDGAAEVARRRTVMEMGYKALKEAMTNPLADQNPLRNPAQSQDPNRGLGLITLRLR